MTRRKPHSKIGPSSGQSDAVTAPGQYARALHHTQERYALSRVYCGDAIYTNTFPTLYNVQLRIKRVANTNARYVAASYFVSHCKIIAYILLQLARSHMTVKAVLAATRGFKKNLFSLDAAQ